MKRMVSRKSYSWWWDSHITRNKSKWLDHNLQKMDQTIKEMMILIEEEGESFAKKAEIYYQRRPKLIAHVEDLYRMYRALAERYDKATGDHCNNSKSEQNSPCSGNGSELVSYPSSPCSNHSSEVTPDSKPSKTILTSRAAGFDVFLGSGGCSELSRKGILTSCSSSSESDSDSEFDDSNEANGNAISSNLHCKIHELEDEVHELREKLEAQEKRCHDQCGFKILAMEEEILMTNEKIVTLETENVVLTKTLEDTYISHLSTDTELSSAKKTTSNVKKENNVFQTAIIDHWHELEVLKGEAEAAAKQFLTELSNRDCKIKEYENELDNAKEKFWQEKSSLKAQIAELELINMRLTAECQKVLEEKILVEACLSEQEIAIQELKASTHSTESFFEKLALEPDVVSLRDQVKQAEANRIQACKEMGKRIIELDENLEALKSRADTLVSEKDALATEVVILTNDVKYRDDRIDEMDQHLRHLNMEHAKLIMEIEEARNASSDMKSRIKGFEEEVERQKNLIADGAEEKREAIRQLCVSIEHYRERYEQLLQLLQGYRLSTIAAT